MFSYNEYVNLSIKPPRSTVTQMFKALLCIRYIYIVCSSGVFHTLCNVVRAQDHAILLARFELLATSTCMRKSSCELIVPIIE